MFIFVREGIRKLSDLKTVRGNNIRFILLRWSKDELIRAGTCSTNKIGKSRVRPSSEGRVAVSEQILHHKQTKPTVDILCTELVARYGSIRLTRAR